jgi:hypothetical protein
MGYRQTNIDWFAELPSPDICEQLKPDATHQNLETFFEKSTDISSVRLEDRNPRR